MGTIFWGPGALLSPVGPGCGAAGERAAAAAGVPAAVPASGGVGRGAGDAVGWVVGGWVVVVRRIRGEVL